MRRNIPRQNIDVSRCNELKMMDYLLIFTTHSIWTYFIGMHERTSTSRIDASWNDACRLSRHSPGVSTRRLNKGISKIVVIITTDVLLDYFKVLEVDFPPQRAANPPEPTAKLTALLAAIGDELQVGTKVLIVLG